MDHIEFSKLIMKQIVANKKKYSVDSGVIASALVLVLSFIIEQSVPQAEIKGTVDLMRKIILDSCLKT